MRSARRAGIRGAAHRRCGGGPRSHIPRPPGGCSGPWGCSPSTATEFITTSGGGALLSNDAGLVAQARHLASQARQPVAHYEHRELGYNYRLSNLLASVGRAQLSRLDALSHDDGRFTMGIARPSRLDGITFSPELEGGHSTHWLTCLLLDEERVGARPEHVCEHLGAHNIEARPVWKPMHLQPVHRSCRAVGGAVAQDLFRRGVCCRAVPRSQARRSSA